MPCNRLKAAAGSLFAFGCYRTSMAFVKREGTDLACDDDELKCDYLCIGAGTTNPYPKP